MKPFILIMISLILAHTQASARALLGALNTPVAISTTSQAPSANCSCLNSFGFLNPLFLSRSETFKILKIKPLGNQEISNTSLQSLKDSFMQATSVFKNNFDVDLESSAALVQIRNRLLTSVGYNEKHIEKADLTKMASEDLRWKSALQKISCNLQSCKSPSDAVINYDILLLSKTFKKDLESALLDQTSESITVDEMLSALVVPNERARLRLFSALLTQVGIPNETRWSCSKTAGEVHFTSRVEVALGKDTWASDTALSSDYTQKSSQICFSSLAKLNELCSAKKGAPL